MAPPHAFPSILLASASPRRRELLQLSGWPFRSTAVDVDEAPLPGEGGRELAARLSLAKARAAAPQARAGELVLAADTVVSDGGAIYGKPLDRQDAERILAALAGRNHQVHTALALLLAEQQQVVICTTEVPMRRYAGSEVAAYLDSGSALDKAGAYGIQDADFHPVDLDQLVGCYANVMGLPLCHLQRSMAALGFTSPADIPLACQRQTGYDCPVYTMILRGDL